MHHAIAPYPYRGPYGYDDANAGKKYADDVKSLTEPVLGHRVIMNPAARIRNVQSGSVLQEILQSVPVPGTRVPA